MKRFIFCILVCLAFPAAVFAATESKAAFFNASGASLVTRTSAVFNVLGYKTKTVQVSGVVLTSSPTSIIFKNMSGTLTAQCAPSEDGPWASCIAGDYAQTAVTKTVNGPFTWSDSSSYVRFLWLSGTKGGKLSAWFNYLDK